MSSGEGLVACGSALQPVEDMAVDMAVDMGLVTPSKKRPNGSQFWVNDTDSESVDDETNSGDDGFKPVDIKARRAAKLEKNEKKIKLAEVSLDSLKRTGGKTRPNKPKSPVR